MSPELVAYFMSDDGRQFGFVLRQIHCPLRYKNQAIANGKRIRLQVTHYHKPPDYPLSVESRSNQTGAQVLHILCNGISASAHRPFVFDVLQGL